MQHHLVITPRADSACHVGILGKVGSAQTAHQRRSELEPINREGLLQPFQQTGRRVWMLLLQLLARCLSLAMPSFLGSL
jgi:hypothetical protein